MARTVRPKPKLLFSEQEEAIYNDYIKAYKADYPGLTRSDLLQLEVAGTYHVLALRLASQDVEQDLRQWSNRYHPRQLERGILQDLALTRKERLSKQPASGDVEEDLRRALLALSTE